MAAFGRRSFLKGTALAAASAALPTLLLPRRSRAQTPAFNTVKHLVYIRLASAFRFTCAFNADVADDFNPFGGSSKRAAGTEWGVGKLLEGADFLSGTDGAARVALGMKSVASISNELCVLPCVDHEPFSNRADGNHGTGLERFLTGYVGGSTSFLTYLNWGLRDRVAQATSEGKVLLPAFSFGEGGMALGGGAYAAYRPPVLDGEGFDRFSFDADAALPPWASKIATRLDESFRQKIHPSLRGPVEAYQQTREAAHAYGQIFRSDVLRVSDASETKVDGISNKELVTLFGDSSEGRAAALGLRLFHFGCPAVFLNQGGYDFHSQEESSLPGEIMGANWLVSALHAALKRMTHPAGGTYWDHTLVVLGSEFGRTTNGSRFNSAQGSDHSTDFATRWMSMPFMGGVISKAGKAGRQLGETSRTDLHALGTVFSYRSVMKTMLDWLGADSTGVFPADDPIQEFFS